MQCLTPEKKKLKQKEDNCTPEGVLVFICVTSGRWKRSCICLCCRLPLFVWMLKQRNAACLYKTFKLCNHQFSFIYRWYRHAIFSSASAYLISEAKTCIFYRHLLISVYVYGFMSQNGWNSVIWMWEVTSVRRNKMLYDETLAEFTSVGRRKKLYNLDFKGYVTK